MIRNAVVSDIPYLVALFQKQHFEMGCSWPINVSVLTQTISQAVVSPNWLCLTDEGCLLLAVCFESPLGAGRLAQELCFCVPPGNLNAVLEHYEKWARDNKCKSISLSCEQRFPTFTRLYGRHGYVQAEATFSKALS